MKASLRIRLVCSFVVSSLLRDLLRFLLGSSFFSLRQYGNSNRNVSIPYIIKTLYYRVYYINSEAPKPFLPGVRSTRRSPRAGCEATARSSTKSYSGPGTLHTLRKPGTTSSFQEAQRVPVPLLLCKLRGSRAVRLGPEGISEQL